MNVYFMPFACSMATRVVLSELNIDATFVEVNTKTKQMSDGTDLASVHPLRQVPTIVTDDGVVITENFAVLMHIADGTPLAPANDTALRHWLGFVGTEIHKGVFNPMFDGTASQEVRDYALAKSVSRLAYLEQHLTDRLYLLDTFTVADAYLITMLHMAQGCAVDLEPFPAVCAYLKRGLARESFKAARAIELPLFIAEPQQASAS